MIRLGRSEIEALIDLPGAAPDIEAAFMVTSKDRVKLPPAGPLALPCAPADCPLVRS